MNDSSQELASALPARKRVNRAPLIAAIVLALAGASLVVWFALKREQPTVVVQRFCSALKGDRFEEAYTMVDWPEGKRVEEKTFVQTAKVMRALATIQKYELGEPRPEGDVTVVPVKFTVSVTSLTGTQEREGTANLRCRLVDGKWKVRPDVGQDFLGLGKMALPGAK